MATRFLPKISFACGVDRKRAYRLYAEEPLRLRSRLLVIFRALNDSWTPAKNRDA
jgi:hypothetical protein